jgi:hypothetical protein
LEAVFLSWYINSCIFKNYIGVLRKCPTIGTRFSCLFASRSLIAPFVK